MSAMASRMFVAEEGLSNISLDEAFADLKLGRKLCRQLRAELHLEDDSFGSAVLLWRNDRHRVEAVVTRLLRGPAGSMALERLASAAFALDASAVQMRPSKHDKISPATCNPPLQKTNDYPDQPSLASVWNRLPRLPPGKALASEGHEERNRALRRRLKMVLPQRLENVLTKELATSLRINGPDWASQYIEKCWHILQNHQDAEELLSEIICVHTEPILQRALRAALAEQAAQEDMSTRAESARPAKAEQNELYIIHSEGIHFIELPEPSILHILSFCSDLNCICNCAASCRSLRELASEDTLWKCIWIKTRITRKQSLPTGYVRLAFLRLMASRCVECQELTIYEHALVGCRLCESCERSNSKYALMRSSTAMKEFQLTLAAMKTLPHLDGVTGRVYLRSSLENLAAKLHSGESLQRLRAKRDVGAAVAGRQRKPKGGNTCQRQRREDDDPCCFEATALIRASEG